MGRDLIQAPLFTGTTERYIGLTLVISLISATILALSVGPALAEEPEYASNPPHFSVDLQLWQDRELLTHPKLTLPQNEYAEITVDDPFIYPDKVKVELRLVADQNANTRKIQVETAIFLPRNGAWQEAATPIVSVEPGKRTTVEVPVASLGFQHTDGSPVQSLILFVMVNNPA